VIDGASCCHQFNMEQAARAMARMNSTEVERPARPMPRLPRAARGEPAVIQDPPPPLPAASCFLRDAAPQRHHKAASLPAPFFPEKNNPSSPPRAPCCIRPTRDTAKERVVS
jgi:hypothetical protein